MLFHLWLIDGEEFVSEHAGAFSGDALEEPCEVLRLGFDSLRGYVQPPLTH